MAQRKFKKVRCAIVKLQSLIRMHQLRKDVHKKRNAVVRIQRQWKATKESRLAREEFLNKKRTCTTIQSAIRMYIARKKYISMKNGFIKLQPLARMRIERHRYLQKKQAILIIQSNLRAYCTVQRLRSAHQMKKTAATTIQRHWRAYRARQRVKLNRAAVCIQSLYR